MLEKSEKAGSERKMCLKPNKRDAFLSEKGERVFGGRVVLIFSRSTWWLVAADWYQGPVRKTCERLNPGER